MRKFMSVFLVGLMALFASVGTASANPVVVAPHVVVVPHVAPVVPHVVVTPHVVVEPVVVPHVNVVEGHVTPVSGGVHEGPVVPQARPPIVFVHVPQGGNRLDGGQPPASSAEGGGCSVSKKAPRLGDAFLPLFTMLGMALVLKMRKPAQ